MKIAWFTPFSKKSAIGKYSQSITNTLNKICEVDLWISENAELLPTEIQTVYYSENEDLSPQLKGYDFIIYNMGNYLPFHKDIYEISKKIKGIVILHDFVMHHFFADYYLNYKKSLDAYIGEMEKLYGEEGRHIAIHSIEGKGPKVWETEDVLKYPFFEKAIDNAAGVIVHSQFQASEVNKRFLGPLNVIYHPFYDSNKQVMINNRVTKTDLGIFEDKLLVLTVGHVNPNKRIDKMIKILGENQDLAKKISYIIIGACDHVPFFSNLQSLVERYGLHETVKFLGYQSDNILYAYMANADIFVNLRFPPTEGASWSLIEQLHFGSPVIVTDTGFYSELPDDTIIKIGIETEEMELLKALSNLIDDDKLRKNIGIKGRQFAIENFNAQKYRKTFFDFLIRVKEWKPILELIDKVSEEFATIGVSEDMGIVDQVTMEIYQIVKNAT